MNRLMRNSHRAIAAATTSADVQTDEAQQELSTGQEALGRGDYVSALENFQAASVSANAAQLTLSVTAQLGASGGEQATTSTSTSDSLGSQTATDAAATTSTSTQSGSNRSNRSHRTRSPHPHF